MKFVTRKKKTDIIAFDNVPLEKQSNAATCQLPQKMSTSASHISRSNSYTIVPAKQGIITVILAPHCSLLCLYIV